MNMTKVKLTIGNVFESSNLFIFTFQTKTNANTDHVMCSRTVQILWVVLPAPVSRVTMAMDSTVMVSDIVLFFF